MNESKSPGPRRRSPTVVAAVTGLVRPAELPLKPIAAVFGGIVFGASMRWAGGCAAGTWYTLGAGDVGALLGMAWAQRPPARRLDDGFPERRVAGLGAEAST